MTRHPDTDTIEESIDRSRKALGSTLDELQDRISVDNLAQEALGMLRSNAAAYTRSIDSAVRANPLALALTGAGLAWLIFGNRSRPASVDSAAGGERWSHSGGSRPYGAYSRGYDPDAGENHWSDRIDTLRGKASEMLHRIERDASEQAGSLRDFAAERAKVLASFTDDMRESFMDGLEDLSQAARDRIVEARQAAYSARLQVQSRLRAGGREVGQMVNDHPIIAGGVALALGAAFATALPRSRVEDRTFGAESDRLMDRAATLLREERSRMSKLANDAASDIKGSVEDVTDALADRVAQAGEDIRERAKAKAKKSGGKSAA